MVKLAGIVPYAHRIAMLDSPKLLQRLWRAAVAVGSVCFASGCARWDDVTKNMFVNSTPVVATVGAQVATGKLHVYADSSGFVSFESDTWKGPVLSCSGRMPVPSFVSREIHLRCNNGVQSRVTLGMRTELRGYGYSTEGDVPVGLVIGLEPSEAIALLNWPAQWRLDLQDGRYQISLADTVGKPLPPVEAADKPSP